MSVTKKLILVATLPAILACSFVMFAAITDMHKQRDHLVEYTATLIETNNSNPLSTSDAQNRVKQAWTEKYDELASVAIPSLILVLIALVATALFFVTRITKGLNHLVEGVKILSSPETSLSYRVSIDEAQDLEPIVLNVNGMMGRIEQAFLQVKDISVTIDEASKLLADNADSNQQNSENLLANMESVSTAMVELQSASQEISNNVQSAYKEVSDINNQGQDLTQEVNSLNELLNHLKQVAESSANDVNELNTQVEGIHGILQTIQGIAEQTNLLALNAAIEAARAGEQGRGFAVVADEVRDLASKTQQSTEEIHRMITGLREGANRSIKAMDESTNATDNLATSLNSSNDRVLSLFDRLTGVNQMNEQIATASEEQTNVIDEVSRHALSAKSVSESTLSSAQTTGEQATSLGQSSTILSKMMDNFKFD